MATKAYAQAPTSQHIYTAATKSKMSRKPITIDKQGKIAEVPAEMMGMAASPMPTAKKAARANGSLSPPSVTSVAIYPPPNGSGLISKILMYTYQSFAFRQNNKGPNLSLPPHREEFSGGRSYRGHLTQKKGAVSTQWSRCPWSRPRSGVAAKRPHGPVASQNCSARNLSHRH